MNACNEPNITLRPERPAAKPRSKRPSGPVRERLSALPPEEREEPSGDMRGSAPPRAPQEAPLPESPMV